MRDARRPPIAEESLLDACAHTDISMGLLLDAGADVEDGAHPLGNLTQHALNLMTANDPRQLCFGQSFLALVEAGCHPHAPFYLPPRREPSTPPHLLELCPWHVGDVIHCMRVLVEPKSFPQLYDESLIESITPAVVQRNVAPRVAIVTDRGIGYQGVPVVRVHYHCSGMFVCGFASTFLTRRDKGQWWWLRWLWSANR